MARITSERAVEIMGNKFEMILVAAARARELARGSRPLVESSNGNIVTALREIEAGKIDKLEYLRKRK
jgi:DNA-directed RNA polymerase subunit omega